VIKVDAKHHTLVINYYGRQVEYDKSQVHEIEHARAITIYKSQGSEYDVVVVPLFMCHARMLNRSQLFVGMTRAKKLTVLVGTKQALAIAMKTVAELRRNTALGDYLADPLLYRVHCAAKPYKKINPPKRVQF
jgi:exodeoxyribonuclease V alpha subunit